MILLIEEASRSRLVAGKQRLVVAGTASDSVAGYVLVESAQVPDCCVHLIGCGGVGGTAAGVAVRLRQV